MSIGRDELGHRSETVRRANLSAIVSELHASGPLSRSDLVARTGLTRSAIRGLIGELVAGRLAFEGPAAARRHTGTAVTGRPRRFPREPSSWPSRSRSIRSPPRRSDSAGRSSTSFASTCRAADRASSTSPRSSPSWRRISATGSRRRRTSSASGSPSSASSAAVTAWSRWRRTSAGATSHSVRSWPVRSGMDVPIAFANEADLAASPSIAAARRAASTTSCSSGARSAWAVGSSSTAGRSSGPRATAGRSVTSPSTRMARRVGAGRSAVGRRKSASGALLRRAGRSPESGREAFETLLAEAEAGDPVALDAFAETGAMAWHRPRRDHQHAQSEPRPARRSIGRELSLRPVDLGGRARSARVARLTTTRPGRADALGDDAPLLGQRSSRSDHCSPTPRHGCVPAGPWPRWQAPEEDGRRFRDSAGLTE